MLFIADFIFLSLGIATKQIAINLLRKISAASRLSPKHHSCALLKMTTYLLGFVNPGIRASLRNSKRNADTRVPSLGTKTNSQTRLEYGRKILLFLTVPCVGFPKWKN